jgi:hypothetical protein
MDDAYSARADISQFRLAMQLDAIAMASTISIFDPNSHAQAGVNNVNNGSITTQLQVMEPRKTVLGPKHPPRRPSCGIFHILGRKRAEILLI